MIYEGTDLVKTWILIGGTGQAVGNIEIINNTYPSAGLKLLLGSGSEPIHLLN